ncbi:MAG: type II toxin-antitoxin system RelE/ParE family toxin [Pedobacter sp.]|nr:MAG: type II toxin-antitoxin system RelE/ParE family toxin [Pedobacter sp.]
MEKRIVWSRISLEQLNQIFAYIAEVSMSDNIAERMVNQIYRSAKILENNYEIYPLDIHKTNNDGSYRAYEIVHYRISYKISEDEIQILAVRHTSRTPRKY